MRIAYINNNEARAKPVKKPTKKELQREKALQWVLKQKAINQKKAEKLFSKEIAEIRLIDPNFLKHPHEKRY